MDRKRVWEVALTVLVAIILLVAAEGQYPYVLHGAEDGCNGGRGILGYPSRSAHPVPATLGRSQPSTVVTAAHAHEKGAGGCFAAAAIGQRRNNKIPRI